MTGYGPLRGVRVLTFESAPYLPAATRECKDEEAGPG
jgi:hypothetical protein